MAKVGFNYLERKLNITNKNKLKSFIEYIFKKENIQLEKINYIFCSDEFLLNINQQYLQHDYYTDIITFDLSNHKDIIIGEVYISIDRVYDNADKLNEGFSKEVLRVIFHGALHLCGYKDKSTNDEQQMRRKEEQYITLYCST